ncbi:MFS transporter [Kangiella taiwanensis]|uniref:Tetracycline resistance MFS efflux pump n=1 Tax=Kangiella taiwanensis TaxID=1079179 RepID=A0ABP8I5R7_9GAMM|nr:MFS transporter [Kangiella taiwanensis]
MTKQKAMWVLASVMLLSVLGTAGIALPYPVLAPYFLDSPPNDLTHFMGIHPKILLGFSLAFYPLGLLIGNIFVGALSDSYGRRKLLLITLFGSVVGYLLTAVAVIYESFIGFTLARLLTGVCEGNMSIARAIAAELHPHIERTKAISMSYAANYAGWLIGPVVGGFLVIYGVSAVFLIAALGIGVAFVLVFFTIERRELSNDTSELHFWTIIRRNNSLTLLKNKNILPIFWFYFLYSMGLNAFYDFYPVWFVDYLDADSQTIAWATVALTACMIIVSSFVVDKLNSRFGEVRLMIVGGSLLCVALVVQPFIGTAQVYLVFGMIGVFIAIANGMVPTYLSKYFGHLGQGKVMGLQTSTFCVTNVIIASAGGPLSILSSRWVILTGAALVLASIVVMFVTRQQQKFMMDNHEREQQDIKNSEVVNA